MGVDAGGTEVVKEVVGAKGESIGGFVGWGGGAERAERAERAEGQKHTLEPLQ